MPVLEWYYQLSNRRQIGMDGPQAITYEQMHAWSAVTGIRLPPFAVNLICRLDDVYHTHLDERREKRKKTTTMSGKTGEGE